MKIQMMMEKVKSSIRKVLKKLLKIRQIRQTVFPFLCYLNMIVIIFLIIFGVKSEIDGFIGSSLQANTLF